MKNIVNLGNHTLVKVLLKSFMIDKKWYDTWKWILPKSSWEKKPLAVTKEDYEDFDKFTIFQICKKVKYHHHITGKYQGSVYQVGNLILSLTEKVYIVFHIS